MKKLILFSLIVLFSAQAFSAQLDSSISGRYHKNYNPQIQKFIAINVKGDSLSVHDEANDLKYQFDLTKSGEQEMVQYPSYLRSKSTMVSIGNMISKVTISDIKVINSKKVAASINYYISYSSVFGKLNTKVKLSFVAEEINDSIRLTAPIGRIVSLESSLSEETNKAMGMILDLVIRTGISGVDVAHDIYRQ